MVAHSVSRLDAAYEAFSGAAVYQGSAAAQERHLRGAIACYFDEEGPASSTLIASAGAAGAADAAMAGGAEGPSSSTLMASAGAAGAADADASVAGGAKATETSGAFSKEGLAVGESTAAAAAAGIAGSGQDGEQHQQQQQQRQQRQQQQQQQQQQRDDDEAAGPIRRPDAASLGRSVRAFLRNSRERIMELGQDKMTPLAVARVLHGLPSPVVRADQWRKCGDWGRMQAVDFGVLVAAARSELDVFWEAQAQQGADSDAM